MFFQQLEVLLPYMEMLPESVLHSLSLWPDQDVHLVSLRVGIYPLFEEVLQKVGLFLEVEIQKNLGDDTLGCHRREPCYKFVICRFRGQCDPSQ